MSTQSANQLRNTILKFGGPAVAGFVIALLLFGGTKTKTLTLTSVSVTTERAPAFTMTDVVTTTVTTPAKTAAAAAKEKPAAKPKADPASVSNAYFLRMDNYAVALDGLIQQQQKGQSERANIAALSTKILRLANTNPGKGTGGNRLRGAAVSALAAIDSDDQPRLAKQRREIAFVRNDLAVEALG